MSSGIAREALGELFDVEVPRWTFPAVEIITARLRLRSYTAADVDEHAAIFDHELARDWSIAPQPYDRRRALAWCTREAERIRLTGDGICWAGEDRETGRLVGMTGFHNTDWERRVADVSATAAASVIGRGYATEALRAMSHWLLTKQGFNRIQILTDVRNRAPQYVAEACGFVHEGVLRNGGNFRDRTVDMAVYSLIPSDLDRLTTPEYEVRSPGLSRPAHREMEMT